MYLFFILIISAIFEHVGAQRNSPSQQPTQPIYGDSIDSVGLSPTAAQAVMGALIFAIFVGMLSSFQSPEVLFLGAVCVALVLQIITLSDALSGKIRLRNKYSPMNNEIY